MYGLFSACNWGYSFSIIVGVGAWGQKARTLVWLAISSFSFFCHMCLNCSCQCSSYCWSSCVFGWRSYLWWYLSTTESSFWLCSCTYFKEANYCTDWIAHYGRQTGSEFVPSDNLPQALLYLIEVDTRGISSSHIWYNLRVFVLAKKIY